MLKKEVVSWFMITYETAELGIWIGRLLFHKYDKQDYKTRIVRF